MSTSDFAKHAPFKPSVTTDDLDVRLENAMRRAAESVGVAMGRHRGRIVSQPLGGIVTRKHT